MYFCPAKVLCRNDFTGCHFYQRGTAQKAVSQFIDHHRFTGHKNDVGTACSITAGAHGNLFKAHCRHPSHIVKHGSEMLVVGENFSLHGKESAA